jgi:hypothetical protein
VDLSLHGRILRRYWQLVFGGIVLAVGLSVLSVARPALDGPKPTLTYRTSEVWQSRATLLLTQPGFPEGRLVTSADPGRFFLLVDLYAQLAKSDNVRRILANQGPVKGNIDAIPLRPVVNAPSSVIQMIATGPSPESAQNLTKRATDAFITYVGQRQRAAKIPTDNRVTLSVVRRAEPAALIEPRKRTLPVMIFLAVVSATVGLIYVLERLRLRRRPAIRSVPAAAEEPLLVEPPDRERDENLVASRSGDDKPHVPLVPAPAASSPSATTGDGRVELDDAASSPATTQGRRWA